MAVANLCDPNEEPEDDLEDDVKEEVVRLGFGPLEQHFLYQPSPAPAPPGYGPRVFLAFSRPEAAAGAVAALNGRRFASRVACAFLFPEEKLAAWDLMPGDVEVAVVQRAEKLV